LVDIRPSDTTTVIVAVPVRGWPLPSSAGVIAIVRLASVPVMEMLALGTRVVSLEVAVTLSVAGSDSPSPMVKLTGVIATPPSVL
jgi:hypothetical protein